MRMPRLSLCSAVVFSCSAALSCGTDANQPVITQGVIEQGGSGVDSPAADESAPGEMAAPAGVAETPANSEGGPTVLAPAVQPSEGAAAPGDSPAVEPPAPASPDPAAPDPVAEPDPAEPDPAVEPETDTALPVGPEPNPANLAICTGRDPISCHFGGAPGNYFVTVILGGEAAARTQVLSETRRVMLPTVATAAGQTRRLTFGVNVRQPEGEPIQAVPAGISGLDLYFRGSDGVAPAVSGIGFERATAPFMIYVAGDSTVADQTGVDYGGWAQQLPQYFNFPTVVSNYADSGESSASFLNARPLFSTIETALRPNDVVLIQFGHNDKTVTAAQFHDSMTGLVTRTKAKGARPVLFSPVARAQFNGTAVATQHVNGTGANLPAIVAQVASEQNVPFLDLTARTTEWLRELGPNGWQPFHALGTDVTHTNDPGAAVEAGFVRDLIVEAQLTFLTSHLR